MLCLSLRLLLLCWLPLASTISAQAIMTPTAARLLLLMCYSPLTIFSFRLPGPMAIPRALPSPSFPHHHLPTLQHHIRGARSTPASTRLHGITPAMAVDLSYLKEVTRWSTRLLTYTPPPSASYFLTRVVFLRSLGFIYFVAFLVSLNQNRALLGDRGILPIRHYLDRVESRLGGSKWSCFWRLPTILWFLDRRKMVCVIWM